MRHLRTLLQLLYERPDSELDALAERFRDLAGRARDSRRASLRSWGEARGKGWVDSPDHVVYVAYADLLTRDHGEGPPLRRCLERLDYLAELGVTNLHLLPIFKSSGDAGFAVDDYRTVDPRLGSNQDLIDLSEAAHARGMALTLDFVCNHVSDSHEWALAARSGDVRFLDYFVADPTGTGAPWPGVPDVFPDFAPGHWDWVPEIETYLWSTFYSRQPRREGKVRNAFAQWDLNYRNPEVLFEMCASMLHIVNQGVDCLRLDAVPFLWKRAGTSCLSQPELHVVLRIFRQVLDEVAPEVALLAEANDVLSSLAPYFGEGGFRGREVQLCYGFPFMPFFWYAVAFGDALPLKTMLHAAPEIPAGCSWLLFDEVHDEVSLEIVERVIEGPHGRDLNRRLFEHFTREGRGVPFRFDPATQEYGYGFSGTRWSLLGGQAAEDEELEGAYQRIALLEALKLSFPGTPLVYSGAELGLPSDLSYRDDPERAPDSRFAKRVALPQEAVDRRRDRQTREGRIFQDMQRLLAARRAEPAFGGCRWVPLETEASGTLAFLRPHETGGVYAVFNFSSGHAFLHDAGRSPGARGSLVDVLTGEERRGLDGLSLPPRSFRWLKAVRPA